MISIDSALVQDMFKGAHEIRMQSSDFQYPLQTSDDEYAERESVGRTMHEGPSFRHYQSDLITGPCFSSSLTPSSSPTKISISPLDLFSDDQSDTYPATLKSTQNQSSFVNYRAMVTAPPSTLSADMGCDVAASSEDCSNESPHLTSDSITHTTQSTHFGESFDFLSDSVGHYREESPPASVSRVCMIDRSYSPDTYTLKSDCNSTDGSPAGLLQLLLHDNNSHNVFLHNTRIASKDTLHPLLPSLGSSVSPISPISHPSSPTASLLLRAHPPSVWFSDEDDTDDDFDDLFNCDDAYLDDHDESTDKAAAEPITTVTVLSNADTCLQCGEDFSQYEDLNLSSFTGLLGLNLLNTRREPILTHTDSAFSPISSSRRKRRPHRTTSSPLRRQQHHHYFRSSRSSHHMRHLHRLHEPKRVKFASVGDWSFHSHDDWLHRLEGHRRHHQRLPSSSPCEVDGAYSGRSTGAGEDTPLLSRGNDMSDGCDGPRSEIVHGGRESPMLSVRQQTVASSLSSSWRWWIEFIGRVLTCSAGTGVDSRDDGHVTVAANVRDEVGVSVYCDSGDAVRRELGEGLQRVAGMRVNHNSIKKF
jgi:hypothetical protein